MFAGIDIAAERHVLARLDEKGAPIGRPMAITEDREGHAAPIGPDLLRQLTCLEPACGRGHTAKALSEHFGLVQASDIHAYGFLHR